MQPDEMADLVVATMKGALGSALGPVLARLAVLEGRELVHGKDGRDGQAIVGPQGIPGEKGVDGARGQDGVGLVGLVVSADDRLIATMTDGRTLDAGPIPVKEGPAGRDADVSRIAALEAELAELRAELAKEQPVPDIKALLLPDVKQLVEAEVWALPPAVAGKDGSSVTVDDVAPIIMAEVKRAVEAIPPAKDGAPGEPGVPGKSVDVSELEPMIVAEVTKAVAALPPAKDGAQGAPGVPGKSVDVADLELMIVAHVGKAVAAIPVPKDGDPGPVGKDGQSVTLDDVAPMVAAEVHKAVSAIPVPKDGVGLAGAVIDRSGRLVLTLSDGTVKELGEVVGSSVDMVQVKHAIEQQVALIPRPKDGKDGYGFDDLNVLHDGERGFTLQFTRGEEVKSFSFTIPFVIYRGRFGEDRDPDTRPYEKGDSVTFSGCQWTAKTTTAMKPDFTPASSHVWQLSVKEGRKGKDADPAVIESMVNKAVAKLPKPKDPQK